MLRNEDPKSPLTIFFSGKPKPLQLWDKKVKDGHVKSVADRETPFHVLELVSSKSNYTYITSPHDVRKTLGVRHSYLNMTVKNLGKMFAFEFQILDDKSCRRRFHASTFITTSEVKPFLARVPLTLEEGWNQIQVNMADMVRRAYGTQFKELLRVQLYSNCRVRRVFFSDEPVEEEDLSLETESKTQTPNIKGTKVKGRD